MEVDCIICMSPLVSWANEPITLSLPSPPFTPASLHFTLGFFYTGTLIFSNRNYDLNIAFAIQVWKENGALRGATAESRRVVFTALCEKVDIACECGKVYYERTLA
jgi:hypothetical protein